MAHWQVVVGNVGTVYEGTEAAQASGAFWDYRDLSVRGVGRAAGESVTMIRDGSVFWHEEGTVGELA
jgi:hypothetical protein